MEKYYLNSGNKSGVLVSWLFKLAFVLIFCVPSFVSQAQMEISEGMDFSKKIYNKAEKAISDDLFTEADFKLYPNPASSVIHIQSDVNLKEGVILTLVDVRGNILEKRILNKDPKQTDYTFDLWNYSNGQYFLGIRAMDGTFVSKKFIKRS